MVMNILKHILISAGPFAGLTDSKFIVNFLLLVDSKIYELFDTLYGLYLSIASARIFDINTFDAIINNIYVFFGVVALFILAFNLLQAMINPDDLNKSTNSIKQFISRFAIAVFLTCITPALFDFLYDFQEAIMKFQVIPKAVLGDSGLDTTQTSVVGYQNENGELLCTDGSVYNETDNPCELKTTEYEVDVGNAILTSDGYGIAYHVFRGFMHPSGTASDVEVNASEYFTSETGFWATWGGCAVGAVGTAAAAGITALVTYFTGGTATGFAATLTTKTGALAATACVAAAGIGYTVNSVGEAITAKEYLWSQAERAMLLAGDFSTVPAFDSAVVNGDMSYTPIVSTVAGLILVYLVFSFCLDLGVRAAKLIFYQLLAPVSFLISTIPSKKDLMSKWFKAVLTTWMEVFVRIFVMCGTALLIRELNLDGLSELGLLAQGIIVLGLVTFAKQFPKLLSEITGISSGNMKLGIKEKLAEGGAFTAGALVGGGLTAGVRNLTNAGKNVVNKYQQNRQAGKGRLASAFGASGTAIRGLGSTAAGVVSGGVRSGKAGLGAKSFKDMKGAAAKGSTDAINARNKRANYRAAHGGFIGAMEGHVKDFGSSAKNYFLDESIEGLTRESQSMGKLYSKYNTFNDTIENLLEKEQSKGGGSVFLGNGYALANYAAFDTAAQNLATAKTQFNNGVISAAQLRAVEGAYIAARDAARDELMDMALQGSKGAGYTALSAKGQAALKDSLVNAESLQATILENANTRTVQEIMGANGNGALSDIMNNVPLTTASFAHNGSKLKDAAKVAQGQADIKIAEMNKEQAAKGDKK